MAVACARSPVGAVASGRHGVGMLSIGGTSDDALKAHAANWQIYEQHAREAKKPIDRRKWRIVTFAHVAATREQARQDVAFGLKDFARYFNDVATFPIIPAGVDDPLDFLTREGLACIGTPDDCIRHFERLWLGSGGGFGAVLLLSHNWADWQATMKSYELMARFGREVVKGTGAEYVQAKLAERDDRHAKAGELCEHVDTLHLVRGDAIERAVPTYRGDGAPAFL